MMVQKRLPRFKVGTILLCIDSMIVLAGAILLKNAMALVYSEIYAILCSVAIDWVMAVLWPGLKQNVKTPKLV